MINGQTKLDTAKSMEKEKFNDFLDWKQGCVLTKIEGSPVLWSCEIQGAQHNYDFYEKTKIFLSPGGKSKVPRATRRLIKSILLLLYLKIGPCSWILPSLLLTTKLQIPESFKWMLVTDLYPNSQKILVYPQFCDNLEQKCFLWSRIHLHPFHFLLTKQ